MVFFDEGSAVIKAQPRQQLASAFSSTEICGYARFTDPRSRLAVNVIGHTDKAGSDAANEQLALRRAEAVAQVLVELGVPRESICISGSGSRLPLANVAGAVPQNRRVELIFWGQTQASEVLAKCTRRPSN